MEGKIFPQGTKVLSFLYCKNDQSYYMCECSTCGHKFRQDGYSTRLGRQGCKYCRTKAIWNPLVAKEPYEVGKLTRLWWAKRVIAVVYKRRKKNPKFEMEIDMHYAWQKFLEQNGKCNYTGLKLQFPDTGSLGGTASLDRIDSSKGYIKDNIQWVHAVVNNMKSDLDSKDFKNYCKLVTKHTKLNK
jgi:hypothetical protein